MKILVLTFYFRPDLCAGAFRCTALMEELTRLYPEAHFDVVTTLPNRYATFHADAPEVEAVGNMTIRRIPLPPHKSGMMDQIRSFSTYYKNAQKIVRDQSYDLVFATSSRLFTAFLGGRLARRLKTPLYLDVRDLFVDTMSSILPTKIAWAACPVLKLVERYAFSRAHRINIVSRGFEDYFRQRYLKVSLSYFTNGIDAEFLKDREKGLERHVFSNPVKVLYVGNIGEGQCLHDILPGLAKATKGRCLFKVVGDGGRKTLLKSKIEAACVDNVQICDPVRRAELVSYYREADVLFLHLGDYPAFKKVLPSKIFEYATTGKPLWAGVSGFAATFLREEVENSAVFPPGNVDEAVRMFDTLVMELRPRDLFVEKFTRSRIMERMAKDIMEDA